MGRERRAKDIRPSSPTFLTTNGQPPSWPQERPRADTCSKGERHTLPGYAPWIEVPVYRRLLISSASASRKLAEPSSSGLNCLTILKAKAAHSLAVPRSRSTRRLMERSSIFVKFVRSQRLPVSMSLIQERSRLSAESNGIIGFKASRGWMRKFIRRNHSACTEKGAQQCRLVTPSVWKSYVLLPLSSM